MAAFTIWPHQPHHECHSARILRQTDVLCWALDHRCRLCMKVSGALCECRTQSACKASLWKQISEPIKLWVSCCWLTRLYIREQRNSTAAGWRLTTRNTCGNIWKLWLIYWGFVAIDTRVYPFKSEHHRRVPGLLLNERMFKLLFLFKFISERNHDFFWKIIFLPSYK